MKITKCIGFDEEGKEFACVNAPGTKWTRFWCFSCDKRRRTFITNRLEELQKHFSDGATS